MKEGDRIGCTKEKFPEINRKLNAEGLMASLHAACGEMLVFTIVKLEGKRDQKQKGKE